MDVLNTWEVADTLSRVFGVIVGSIGLLALIGAAVWAFSGDGKGAAVFLVGAAWFAVCTVLIHADAERYVRHEVTLRPGYVIDAAKYEVIEQRGKIYVIEEREVSE